MATATLEIKGLKELDRALRDLPARVARKVIRQAMRKALAPIKTAVQDNVPRRTGELRSEVKIRAGKRSRGSINMEVRISPNSADGKFHGSFPEYGTADQAGQHFTLRAFESTKDAAVSTLKSEIAAGIEREARA